MDVFRSASASFYLEHSHSGIHHDVHESDSLEVLRRHDILVVHVQLCASLEVGHFVASAAYLYALATVGTAVCIVQAQVALAADCHAERSVAEHFDADEVALRTANILCHNLFVDVAHLPHVEFACKDNDVSELGVELQRLDVRYVELSGEVYLLSHLAAVCHYRHVRCDDCRDLCLFSRVDNFAHCGEVLAVDDGVDCQVTFQSVIVANLRYLFQVFNGEVVGRVRAHVQFAYAKIHRVGTSVDCCCKRLS